MEREFQCTFKQCISLFLKISSEKAIPISSEDAYQTLVNASSLKIIYLQSPTLFFIFIKIAFDTKMSNLTFLIWGDMGTFVLPKQTTKARYELEGRCPYFQNCPSLFLFPRARDIKYLVPYLWKNILNFLFKFFSTIRKFTCLNIFTCDFFCFGDHTQMCSEFCPWLWAQGSVLEGLWEDMGYWG